MICGAVRNYYADAESRDLLDEDVSVASLLTETEPPLSDFKQEDRKAVAAVLKQVVDALGCDDEE